MTLKVMSKDCADRKERLSFKSIDTTNIECNKSCLIGRREGLLVRYNGEPPFLSMSKLQTWIKTRCRLVVIACHAAAADA